MNLTLDCKTVRIFGYREFSLTWPASMQIFGTKEGAYIGKGINSHRIGLEHQYGRRDVMWKRSIQVRASSQTKGLERVWNRERDWGETLKIRFFLSPHTPYRRVRLSRFARVRLLRHVYRFLYWFWEKNRLFCSLIWHVSTLLCVDMSRGSNSHFLNVILNNPSINSIMGRQR